ncbi:MAG: excinuclease ABC subunit UvrC [Spirochaetales bacterium]|nr:excinuclease ABC subunit UvrC [Spirochaetales bacterium]
MSNELLKNIPTNPGVYMHKDKDGNVIYVGKAKNLINRVSQYFMPGRDVKTRALVRNIASIDFIVTNSEVEALILENNLIKKYQPHYNILLKDAKTFPMIKITDEAFPRIIKCREKNNQKDEYFGPFVNVRRAQTLLNLIGKLCRIRRCHRTLQPPYNRTPCLNYHIKRCSGPCAGRITEEDYRKNIESARKFLKGDIDSLIADLTKQMMDLSEKMQYEQAAAIRDQIKIISEYEDHQVMSVDKSADCDFVGYYCDYDTVSFSVIQQRGGQILGKDSFFVEKFIDWTTVLTEFLKSYYLNIDILPKYIYIQDMPEECDIIAEALSEKCGHNVVIRKPNAIADKRILRLAIENAEMYYQERQYKIDKINDLRELKRDLNLPRLPRIIECFDIATLNGKYNTAALVQLLDGRPNKSEYRQLNVEGEGHPDDYAMMEEVVGRRYQRQKNEKRPLPDLIVVDGGKGQISSAKRILELLDLGDIPLVGLAEKNEEIFFPNKSRPLILSRDSKSLRLLQLARDEAHRFSNTRSGLRHRRDTLRTALSEIKGIGPKKIAVLYEKYKSIKKMKSASVEEIAGVPGFNKELAEKVAEFIGKK